jgi:hypothetical protein
VAHGQESSLDADSEEDIMLSATQTYKANRKLLDEVARHNDEKGTSIMPNFKDLGIFHEGERKMDVHYMIEKNKN